MVTATAFLRFSETATTPGLTINREAERRFGRGTRCR